MLNSGKKIALCATKKINILTLAFRYILLCLVLVNFLSKHA